MPRYLVFDSETETHTKYKRKSNPFTGENWVVMRGWKHQGDARCSMSYHPAPDGSYLQIADDVTLLVGHNIKFDLLHEMAAGNPDLKAFFKRGGSVWCTQYAEYLLHAQRQSSQMAALTDVAPRYGGRAKIDGIKELWEAGVLTSEINADLLEDYLIGTEEEDRNSGDVGNTELVFRGQVQSAKALGMLPSIRARMDGLCATTEMEFNGLKIDVAEAKRRLDVLTRELEEVSVRLNEFVKEAPEGLEFNWGSGIQVSCLLFGGTIKYEKSAPYLDEATGELARLKATEKWPVFNGEPRDPATCIGTDGLYRYMSEYRSGMCQTDIDVEVLVQDTYVSGKKIGEGKFKNVPVPGEIKTKIQDFFWELPGVTQPSEAWKGKLLDGKGGPVYGTGSEIIEELGLRDVPFLKDFSRNSALVKEIGTYYVRYDTKKKTYVGMLTCVNPADHIVHHSLNHVNTVTTRLSSSNPNLQNVPRAGTSEVKRMFVSRFGDDGVMLEADYSQLEVVVQGWLTGDTNLVADLNNGIDFHCKRVANKFDIAYEEAMIYCKNEEQSPDFKLWKARRTSVKEFSFQRAYGAGAAAIAASTGMLLEDVKDLMAAEDAMYPGVTAFNKRVQREVEDTAEAFRDSAAGWRVFRRGQWQAPTGTLYEFRTYDAPSWLKRQGITDSFMPTELKNYPIQGTGGEVVQIALGKLWRHFVSTENYGGLALLVNTVHDCVWNDVHKSVLSEVAKDVKRILEGVPEYLKSIFGIECPVKFPAEVEAGPNMYELAHV